MRGAAGDGGRVSLFVVGLGSSGPSAEKRLASAVAALRAHPLLTVRSVSRSYENPAVGGATQARFVNAAVVVETALGPEALLGALHAEEARAGRVRSVPNAARTLDLDVLLGLDLLASTERPALPHPRLQDRPFAVVPALEAIARAGRVPPAFLVEAGRRAGASSPRLGHLIPVADEGRTSEPVHPASRGLPKKCGAR